MISKTTINMAARRNVSLEIMNDAKLGDVLEIARIDDGEVADEFHALYRITADGLFWVSSCFNVEDWPNWIDSDAKLRSLLDLIAAEMN